MGGTSISAASWQMPKQHRSVVVMQSEYGASSKPYLCRILERVGCMKSVCRRRESVRALANSDGAGPAALPRFECYIKSLRASTCAARGSRASESWMRRAQARHAVRRSRCSDEANRCAGTSRSCRSHSVDACTSYATGSMVSGRRSYKAGYQPYAAR